MIFKVKSVMVYGLHFFKANLLGGNVGQSGRVA